VIHVFQASPNSKAHDTSGSTEKDSVHSLEGDGSVTDSGRGPSEEGGDAGGHSRSQQTTTGRGGGPATGGERYLPPPPPPPRGGAYWAQQQLQQRHHHPTSGTSHPTVRFHGLSTMPEEDSTSTAGDGECSGAGCFDDGVRGPQKPATTGRQVGRRGATNGGLRSGLSGGRQHPARVYNVSGCGDGSNNNSSSSTTHLLHSADPISSSYPSSAVIPSSTSSLGRRPVGRGGIRQRGGNHSGSGSPCASTIDGFQSTSSSDQRLPLSQSAAEERATSSLMRPQSNGGCHYGRLYCDNSVIV